MMTRSQKVNKKKGISAYYANNRNKKEENY